MKYFKLMFLLLSAMYTSAQDTHYQTQQFGTRSALLGGAVVGGVRDNTALFYNPGSLGFIDTASVSINANLYRIENIKVENAAGQQRDFKSSRFGSLPLLISGMLPSKNPRLKWGYGLAAPTDFSFTGNARLDAPSPIVDDAESPGLENYIGQVMLKTGVSETLAGLGLGYRLSEKWSIGLTNQVTIRTTEYNYVTLSRFFLNTTGSPLVAGNIWQFTKYNSWRYTAKIGLAYSTTHWDAGLTINTPSINLYGRGSVAGDVTGSNILINGVRSDIVANDQQGKLKAYFKSPLKIAGGVNYKKDRNYLGLSAEYCAGIDAYDVLRANPSAFLRPPDLAPNFGSEEFLRVRSAARPVVNVALGYEYKWKPNVNLMASIRTDNSWYDSTIFSQRGIKPEITSWDIYHVTAGASITKGRSTLSVGLLFSTGSDNDFRQNTNLGQPTEGNFLQAATSISKARYSTIGALVGFSFNFRKF